MNFKANACMKYSKISIMIKALRFVVVVVVVVIACEKSKCTLENY